MAHWDTDVVVVGGGGAGLVAALAAAEQGAEVILLEKTRAPGGNTARSGAMIMAAGSRFQKAAGIIETPEDLLRDIYAKNHQESDPAITMTLCRKAPELVEWLVDSCRCKLEFVADFNYPGHTQFRMHAPPSRTGREFILDLTKATERHPNLTVIRDSAVEQLLTDGNGAVTGVTVRTQDAEDVAAKKVILACNGFGSNKAMVRQYIPEIADALYFGSEGNTGEAVIWGQQLGAALAFMDAYQAHSSVAFPHGTLVTWATVVHGGILANKEGRRFSNEDAGYSAFAQHLLRQTDGVAYVIFDQRIFDLCQSFAELRETFDAGAIRGPAATVQALADRLHIDPAGLAETLQTYNRSGAGPVDPFGRTKGHTLSGPFYGVQVTGALFHTQGGLQINTQAQVLHESGRVIPNLYATGGAAAGISGHGADGYMGGNGLLTALGLGLIAGRHAAAALTQS